MVTDLRSHQQVHTASAWGKAGQASAQAAGYKCTLSSRREGLIPKKGLIAMPGRIFAPGLEGRGEIQMPPVSKAKDTVMLIKVSDEKSQVALLGQQPLPWPSLHPAGPQAGAGLPESWGSKALCRRMILLM